MTYEVLVVQSSEKHMQIENQIGVGLIFVFYAENKHTSLLGKNVSMTSFLPGSTISDIFLYTFLSPIFLSKETVLHN